MLIYKLNLCLSIIATYRYNHVYLQNFILNKCKKKVYKIVLPKLKLYVLWHS